MAWHTNDSLSTFMTKHLHPKPINILTSFANLSYSWPYALHGSRSEGEPALADVAFPMAAKPITPASSCSANSLDTDARLVHMFDSPSNSHEPTPMETTMRNSDLDPSYLRATPTLSQHFTILQEHADAPPNEEAIAEDDGLTPRHENRREGLMVETHPSLANERRSSRNPLPPGQSRSSSPPPLEEILRRRTIDDADNIQNFHLQHTSTGDSRAPTAPRSSSDDLSRTDTRRSSIAVFAKGLVSRVPDLRMFGPDSSADGLGFSRRRPSQDQAWNRVNKKDRKLSFAPLPIMVAKQSYAADPSHTAVGREPPTPTTPKKPPLERAVRSGLSDRRKVKLDLPLPVDMSNIPARGRSPVINLASLTPSRPRSPKTPWTRNEQPKWEPIPIVKSPPILEEDYIQSSIMGAHSRSHGGMGLLSGSEPIFSSSSSPIELPATRIRDRCYITRTRFPRSRSGRSGRSGTSDSIFATTPETAQSPEDPRIQWEQQALTNVKLQELGQATISRRGRRWWKTSSDDGQQTPESIIRRFSFNPFKRTNRNSDQSTNKDKKQAKEPSTHKWYSKQPVPFLSKPAGLAGMTVPPTFIPPGVQRVPTPPMFDADGEVKGKLADFFFDVQGGAAPRRSNKTRHTPGGYWDSDALLISLTSDIKLADDEDDNEGPEGPGEEEERTPLHFELNGTPGLEAAGAIAGYLGFSTLNPGTSSPVLRNEAFFRVPHDEALDQPAKNAQARQEDEDRRKFEWMVPEHYPTSWLCPLHEKYKGPWTGLCYWHGKRQDSRVILKGEYASGRDRHGNLKPLGNAMKGNAKNVAVVKRPVPRRGFRGWEVGVYDTQPEVRRKRLASLTT